ncbi:MAG: FlgD immunoglobulin-like domain containing protein [Candidatus Desantisbacteria bacterium]
MNIRRIGILGLMAMMGVFWGYSCVDAAITGVTDNTSGLTKYLKQEIEFQINTNSPATITSIVLTSSEIKSAKEILTGQPSFRLNDLYWNQYEIGSSYVEGKIEIFVVNKATDNGTWSTFLINDYATPQDLFNAINTISFENSTLGSVTYEQATDKIVFKSVAGYEIGLREYCDVANKLPLFTQLKLPTIVMDLIAYTLTEYKGIYTVPVTNAMGTWTVYGEAKSGTVTTRMKMAQTIAMDGSQCVPVTKTRIVGLMVEPSPSSNFFNSSLKRMHVQMAVATLNEELGEDDFTIASGVGSCTLSASKIKTGDQVIIWNDCLRDENNKIIFDHGYVWTKKAVSPGTITFSDADLYFGSATGTYSTAVLKIRNFHVAIGTFTTEGLASFDLGIIKKNIPLHDDGDTVTHWDTKLRDGIFSNTYLVPEEIDVRGVPIVGHFRDGRGYKVSNDGYPFNDEDVSPFVSVEKNNTDTSNDIKININTIPLKIRILMAENATFNPLEGKDCYIKYNLEGAAADVRIIIKTGNGVTIRDLGSYQAMPGDNVASWDGKDFQGNLTKDGKYYYHISATDEAGNKSEDKGLIVITYVQMVVDELVVTVPKAVPGKGIKYISIQAKVSLDGTPEQLKLLNFDTGNSSSVYSRPHALFDIAIYDRYNNEIQKIGPDLVDFTGESSDSDPFPNGKPNYLVLPTDEKDWLRNSGTDTLSDMGDGNNGNDWEIMVPFDKLDITDINERHYEAEFAVTIQYPLDSPLKEGSFYVRGLVNLVSADWKFIDYDDATGNEMWHCAPVYNHYGVHSNSKEKGFEVREIKLPVNMDNTPPVAYESYPSGGVEVSPFEIKSGSMDNGIWVRVEDDGNGSGVDFRSESSYLKLIDSNRMEIAGKATSDGTGKLYFIIDKNLYPNGLEQPGAYTIEVVVRDMANNVSKSSRGFTVSDRLSPDIVSVSPQKDSIYYEGFGLTLSATISELQKGKSGIDWGSSRITLSKDGEDKDIRVYKKISDIEKDVNKNYGVLAYELPWDFLKYGTYTMNVLAWDISGNPASKEISFNVIRGIEIFFNHPELGSVSTLAFKPNTAIFFNGSSTIVSTQTISLSRATITAPALPGYTLFGVPVSVLIGTMSAYGATFSQSVQLTIYYTNTEKNLLPVTKSEDNLVLYGYGGGTWNLILGASKGMYTIKPGEVLYSTYTLAYITPQKWTVMSGTSSEWGSLKNKDWMELVGTITTTAGTPIPNGSITIGIIKDYPSPATGYKILSPVIAFDFKGDKVINFNAPVTIWIHYTKPLPSDAKEGGLTVFGCDKDNQWVKITGNLSTDGNYISFNTNYTYKSYAVMYTTNEVAQTGDETIEQNVWCYPNPAKGGKVNFRYYLPENDVEITVKIYTLLGDLVWEGSQVEGSAGIHDKDFVWNCQNSSSEPVASGVYIYRLTIKPKSGSAAKTVTKKLIVVQ